MPWDKMVDSKATTGLPAARASWISGAMDKYLFIPFTSLYLILKS